MITVVDMQSYSVARWGDWRRHVATLVANSGRDGGGAVVAMGDTLAQMGDTAAAHLCYLIGGIQWGGDKLLLLGLPGDWEDPVKCDRAYLEALQCSQVKRSWARITTLSNIKNDCIQI